jgi:glycosyltransferase involved in cell wall biosynthesis
MLRVGAITGGLNVPSARFRVRQYIRPLADLNVRLEEYASRFGAYPPANHAKRPFWAAAAVLTGLSAAAKSYRHDVTLLQREMVSTLRTLESFTKQPRILDMDDAVWLDQRGAQLNKIAERCDAVICGNAYIADWAGKYNANVDVLPTAVDTDRFRPRRTIEPAPDRIVIGWMGQSSGYPYLHSISAVIRRIAAKYNTVVFRVVSDRPPPGHMRGVEYVKWTAESEVDLLQSFDIGIMPLEDSPWSLGKCSYKMLLCMSCGIPVIVSDFGMNSDVLKRGCVGCGVISPDEWTQALEYLIEAPAVRSSMGKAGRMIVEDFYSVRALAPRFAELLGQPVSRNPKAEGVLG